MEVPSSKWVDIKNSYTSIFGENNTQEITPFTFSGLITQPDSTSTTTSNYSTIGNDNNPVMEEQKIENELEIFLDDGHELNPNEVLFPFHTFRRLGFFYF
jgi:hypothetical protein